MNRQGRRCQYVESSVSERLPDDLFNLNSKSLNKAAQFGLFPMDEGWIAGGVIAKVAMARLRPRPAKEGLTDENALFCDEGKNEDRAEELGPVDPSLPASSLIRLRTSLVKRGLIS